MSNPLFTRLTFTSISSMTIDGTFLKDLSRISNKLHVLELTDKHKLFLVFSLKLISVILFLKNVDLDDFSSTPLASSSVSGACITSISSDKVLNISYLCDIGTGLVGEPVKFFDPECLPPLRTVVKPSGSVTSFLPLSTFFWCSASISAILFISDSALAFISAISSASSFRSFSVKIAIFLVACLEEGDSLLLSELERLLLLLPVFSKMPGLGT